MLVLGLARNWNFVARLCLLCLMDDCQDNKEAYIFSFNLQITESLTGYRGKGTEIPLCPLFLLENLVLCKPIY